MERLQYFLKLDIILLNLIEAKIKAGCSRGIFKTIILEGKSTFMISYCQLSIRENQITFPGSVYKVMTLFNMRNLQLCNWFNEKICYDCINIVLHPVITNTNSQQRRNTVPQVHPPVGCILSLKESNKGRGSISSISSCCPSNAKFITRLHKITENSMMYIYRKGKDEHF